MSEAPQTALTHAEFVKLLHGAIDLYIGCEDYPDDAKLTDLRTGELASFILSELPTQRLTLGVVSESEQSKHLPRARVARPPTQSSSYDISL